MTKKEIIAEIFSERLSSERQIELFNDFVSNKYDDSYVHYNDSCTIDDVLGGCSPSDVLALDHSEYSESDTYFTYGNGTLESFDGLDAPNSPLDLEDPDEDFFVWLCGNIPSDIQCHLGDFILEDLTDDYNTNYAYPSLRRDLNNDEADFILKRQIGNDWKDKGLSAAELSKTINQYFDLLFKDAEEIREAVKKELLAQFKGI